MDALGQSTPCNDDLPSVFIDENDIFTTLDGQTVAIKREPLERLVRAVYEAMHAIVERIQPVIKAVVEATCTIAKEIENLLSCPSPEEIESLLNSLYKDDRKRATQRTRRTPWDYSAWVAPAQPHKVDYG